MTKPLHEQLREAKSDGCIRNMLANITNINPDCSNISCRECHKKHIDAIADRIENEYILRPRYEDGKPVQFLDEVEGCKGPVQCMLFFNDNSGSLYGLLDEQPSINECMFPASWRNASVLKHRVKVLGADGVEIKVGDTVWTINVPKGHDKRIVSGFKPFSEMGTTDGDKPSTHAVMFEGGGWMGNLRVTHKEPDSLEKLRDRMHERWSRAWAEHKPIEESELHGFIDDLTALIERGA